MLDEESWNIPAISDVLLVFVCHFFPIPLWKNLYRIAVLQTGGSNDDDLFPWLYTIDCHIALVRFAERDLTQMRHPFAALFIGHENRVASR